MTKLGAILDQIDSGTVLLPEFQRGYVSNRDTGRVESERFRRFSYDELIARDKANLDITWLRDESLEDPENLPAPEVLIPEIQEEMAAILEQFAEIAAGLGSANVSTEGVP